ncbi:MAG: hypothetical protein ABL977_16860 [Candidatus Eisenbacteria bacterium]
MAQRMRPDMANSRDHSDPEVRQRTIGSMVTASLLAVLGTLVFAWALRAPEYPWLFAVGALPWLVGIVTFARALWTYTHL